MSQNRRIKAPRGKVKAARAKLARTAEAQTERPTPEQEARVKFELGRVVTESGLPYGFAYRRTPLIETMGASGALSPDELNALRFYRTAFDRSERSPVRSCLNISSGGRGVNAASSVINATPGMIDAKRKLKLCEMSLGHTRDTLRAVVLDDKSFRQIAMDRYGSRVTTDKLGREKVAPRSGRHREIIRQEFIAGMRILTDRIRHMVTTGSIEEVWVEPLDDGTATIRRGIAAPAGRYRVWGDNVLVDRVMADLHAKYGPTLSFRTADVAVALLKGVEAGRLLHLEPDELAA
ncbi:MULTISPECIES: hypothetical protein [unclassified Novosphingobium]|uniref:hypothetical protein n=1 Tax=unclassified Novosphingobium TaxID=2644732 RepID=UPI0013587A03|nr:MULTISPECIES: hypothetical protein [unclassified Novosphingobium]